MIVILMGVAGSGKTTLGELLALKLNWAFKEGDALHPEENIKKMSAGIALTDADRLPWLRIINSEIKNYINSGQDAVFTCSALKKSYRDILKDNLREVYFIYLKSPQDVIKGRMSTRKGHFMPLSLLENQLETLEEPAADEALTLDNSESTEVVLRKLLNFISEKQSIS